MSGPTPMPGILGGGRYTRSAAPKPSLRGRTTSYSSILLAILVGVAHAGLAPAFVIGGVKPDLVLVAVVLVTTSFGFEAGIVWAFVAGLVANLLIPEPLGSLPLGLLAAAVVTAAGQRALGRAVWVYPVAAAFVGSAVVDVVSIGALALVGNALGGPIPTQLIVPAAVLNAAIAGLALFPMRLLARRYGPEERAAW